MSKKPKFRSTHGLKFKTMPHIIAGAFTGAERFEIGTVHGIWNVSTFSVDVFACINDEPGNGHMDDVFEWFFSIATERGLPVRVTNVSSEDFRQQLIDKWLFVPTKDHDTLIRFNLK